MSRKLLLAFLALLALPGAPALADVTDTPVITKDMKARPVLWHIKTGRAQMTLFGSIHVLPATLHWVTPDILHALGRTNIFVFEAPTDRTSRTTLDTLMAARGALPEGQSLRAMLPPEIQADYDTVLAAAHLQPALMDRKQPWLASMELNIAASMNRSFYPDAGVDYVMMSWANERGLKVRYLESVEEQFNMLAPPDGDMKMGEFQASLKRFQQDRTFRLTPLVAAWSKGDVKTIGEIMDSDFAPYPDARKRLLTDRNRNWAEQIDAMLKEGGRYFVTVGAAHLAGNDGVPALLRAKGYTVEGP